MLNFIAAYDLQPASASAHAAFVDKATARGWQPWVQGGGRWHRLPSTTLVGSFATTDAAVASLKDASAAASSVLQVPVKLTKWIVATRDVAAVFSDEVFER